MNWTLRHASGSHQLQRAAVQTRGMTVVLPSADASSRRTRGARTLERLEHVAAARSTVDRAVRCAAAAEPLRAAPTDGAGPMGQAAAKLQAFCQALPELDSDVMGLLVSSNPSVVSTPPAEARSKLEQISQLLEVDLVKAAKLVGKVPAAWNRSPEALRLKLQPLAAELGVGLPVAVDLLSAQPLVWAINQPSIVKDRLEALADRVGASIPDLVHLIGKQPIIWLVKPAQVNCSMTQIRAQLGLSQEEALQLVSKMPVLLTLEPRLLVMGMNGLASTMGVPLSRLQDLISRSVGLVTVPAEVLGANLETLAGVLEVEVNMVLELVIRQPTLLATQVANLANAIDVLSEALQVGRGPALDVLIRQPALAYDYTGQSIGSRFDALSKTFGVSVDEVRQLAVQQPALLVITPNTIRAALNAFEEQFGQEPAACLPLLVEDPAAFVLLGYLGNVIEQWCVRLELDPDTVSKLVAKQPGLLEMSPNTVKARLESLSALFDIPASIATQLVMKHPALAAIPPNATITKAKSMSLALGCSMQLAASLMAKEPGVLSCCASAPGELNKDLRPHLDDVQEVVASYEYYTMEWIGSQLKESAPQKVTSFSQMDTRGRPR